MPVEIKQLVIKSKTINDDTNNASFDTERPTENTEESLPQKTHLNHFMTSPDTTRER